MRPLTALLCCCALVACGPPAPAVDPNVDPTGPLMALPTCPPAPPSAGKAPEGIVLPEGTVITDRQEQPPLTNITGYVALTPVQVKLTYVDNPTLQILTAEDEIFEVEILVSNGGYRTYLKGTATCNQGSALLAVVAPELDASAVPLPTGSAAATPSPTAPPAMRRGAFGGLTRSTSAELPTAPAGSA